MATTDLWTYRDGTWRGNAFVGYQVEAADGEIGKVDSASDDSGSSFIVVDTGPMIFGKKVMIPAGLIERVDLDAETVFVGRTKEEIKNAPKYNEEQAGDPTYRVELAGYYGERDQGEVPAHSTTGDRRPAQ